MENILENEEKVSFGELIHLNNFNYCKGRYILENIIKFNIDLVLINNKEAYVPYLESLVQKYEYENYMHILEEIINYLININNLVYDEYKNKPNDKVLEESLKKIRNRYKNVLMVYEDALNNHLDKEVNKPKKEDNKKKLFKQKCRTFKFNKYSKKK